jgi:hypothetical protein
MITTALPPGGRSVVIVALAAAAGGCAASEQVLGPGRCLAPEILSVAVRPNDNNVLSAMVVISVRAADSVAVGFRASEAAVNDLTPPVPMPQATESITLPVFGLLPEREYVLNALAYNGCASLIGSSLKFTTSALPDDLPSYTASGADPSPGYVAFAAGAYGIVIDNTGRVVWYHRFPSGPGLNFQPQPNGRYVARPSPPVAGEIAPWVEIIPTGTVSRTLGCAHGLQPRLHDLIAEPDGSYWIMCDEVRTLDLSAAAGSAATQVMGTVVQHVDVEGELLFEWSPFEHFELRLADLDAVDRTGATVNWTHGNALDIDADGNLLVSFRSLSEIAKIDTQTGTVLWRMGGPYNEFTFESGETPPFARQHGLRAVGAGRVMLLDNLGDPGASRAERYELDETARTARLTGSYGASAGVVAQLGGSTQSLPAGRTLVSFGNGGAVEEYDAAGNVVWRIDGNSGYVFRAHRISSLYEPGVNSPR